MVTIKINNKISSLVASNDIEAGSIVFSCYWSQLNGTNIFYLPNKNLKVDDAIAVDDLFIKVSLSGFGEYIKLDESNNTYPQFSYDQNKIDFIANKNIKKDELITFNYELENFSYVKIQ